MDNLGPWRPIRPLGEGPQCVVWLVEGDARRAAVKVVTPPDPRAVALTEEDLDARLEDLASLDHPGINKVLDWGRLDHGAGFWIALDLLAGDRLSDQAPTAPFAATALQLADALASAHARGVVHGDLKAENVLVEPDGRLVLADFALPIPAERDSDFAAGGQTGTPLWSPPECFEGAPSSPAGDVYALGQLLVELSTGRPSFVALGVGPPALLALAESKLATPSLAPSDAVGPHLAAALRAATDRDPARRPTARAVAEAARRELLGADGPAA